MVNDSGFNKLCNLLINFTTKYNLDLSRHLGVNYFIRDVIYIDTKRKNSRSLNYIRLIVDDKIYRYNLVSSNFTIKYKEHHFILPSYIFNNTEDNSPEIFTIELLTGESLYKIFNVLQTFKKFSQYYIYDLNVLNNNLSLVYVLSDFLYDNFDIEME